MDQIEEENINNDLLLMSLSETNSVYEEQLEQITNKIKLYEAKLKNRVNHEDENTKTEIPNDVKRKLHQAILNEDFVIIEEILHLPEADINMTWFSENLLMCAIRNKKPKVAEYFIDKGINVNFEVELLEFKREMPLNFSEYSCRTMAYDKELFHIVDLIDIFSPKTDPKIVKYLSDRYLKENFKEDKPEEESQTLYNARLLTDFVSDEGEKSVITESKRRLDSQFDNVDDNLYTEAEDARPVSNNSNHVRFDLPIANSVLATVSLVTNNTLMDPLRTNQAIIDELNQSLIKKLMDIQESVNSVISLSRMSRMSNNSDVKYFSYRGYRVDLEMKKHKESLPTIPILSSVMNNHNIKPSTESFYLATQKDIEIRRVLKANETIPAINEDNDYLLTKRSQQITKLPNLLNRIKPVIKSDLVIFQYNENQKYFSKDNALGDPKYTKHLPKIKNYYYINSLKKIPAAQNILLDSLVKYNEPLFPIDTSTNRENRNSFTSEKKVKFQGLVRRHTINSPKNVYKTDSEINENYLNSLKKSGLVNKNCKPLVRKIFNV